MAKVTAKVKARAAKKPNNTTPQPTKHEVVPALERITPELAGDWLAHNTHNRKKKDGRVRRYAAIMERDEWHENAETIKFDWNGILLDGQHRLEAIIVSGKPQRMLVARGLDPASYDTIDTGMPRYAADALYVAGVSNAREIAAALGMLYRYRTTGAFVRVPTYATPTNRQLEELLADEPQVALHSTVGGALARKFNISRAQATVLRYLMCQIDDDDGQLFWEFVLTGESLGADNPIYRLRERLLSKNRIPVDETGAIAIKAWNAYRHKQKMKVLGWRSTKEAMPVPE